MNTQDRRIHWQKWVDPFGADTDNAEWPGAFGTMDSDEQIRQQNLEEEEFYGDDEYENERLVGRQTNRSIPMLSTPMGAIPITEYTNPTKIFNFWTMHTNFRMTKTVHKIVNTTHGVEALNVFTPYRWRIAIGKAFNTSEVKVALQNNLSATPGVQNNGQENY